MDEVTLFQFPSACSHVTMVALEETGIAYSTYLANPIDPDKWAEYLRINPKGKIPALRIGDNLLTENAAILFHLARFFPEARLLPSEPDDFGINQALQDLVWCSATLHPMTRMINAPFRYNQTGDISGIKALGMKNYAPVLQQLEGRFGAGRWWYGAQWSILDTYLSWNYTTAQKAGLDLSAFPAITRHAADLLARPAEQRTIARESAELQSLGALPPNLPK